MPQKLRAQVLPLRSARPGFAKRAVSGGNSPGSLVGDVLPAAGVQPSGRLWRPSAAGCMPSADRPPTRRSAVRGVTRSARRRPAAEFRGVRTKRAQVLRRAGARGRGTPPDKWAGRASPPRRCTFPPGRFFPPCKKQCLPCAEAPRSKAAEARHNPRFSASDGHVKTWFE